MNQLFYNIAGRIVHQIRREKRTTIIGIGFISIFLLKARVLNLTILKRKKNLSLPFRVETDQFVFCLVLPKCLSVNICCTLPSDSKANRGGSNVVSPFPLFFSISASFKNSNPRKRSENCLRFGTDGPSLCIHYCNIIIFCPANINNGRSFEKNFWRGILLTPSACTRTIGILNSPTYTEFDYVAMLAML